MSALSKNECEIESFKSVLEQASARSDNFFYNKAAGILMFGSGVNAARNQTVSAYPDDEKNEPEVKDIG